MLCVYCADIAACGLSEAIQSHPPELREIILKEYIAIKIKEKKEMGRDKVHENILKLPLQIQAADCADGYLFRLSALLFRGVLFPLFQKGGNCS